MNSIEQNDNKPHILFFPLMAQGHTIPLLDMAKLFARRGAKISIITTPVNAPHISKTIEKTQRQLGHQILIIIIKFPSLEAGLAEGAEHLDLIPSPELWWKFLKATTLLAEPLEQVLREQKPNCLVSDMFFPWSNKVASRCEIPRIVFNGGSFFSLSAMQCVRLYQPHKKESSESEPFFIPNFPGEIKLTSKKIPDPKENVFSSFLQEVQESELKSYGILINSFYELESDYVDHFKKLFGRKAWHVGPVSLCNSDVEQKASRGKQASIDEHECLRWLDSKEANSVVYVCFGSLIDFSASQLLEIAIALENSGHNFIWVVRKTKKNSTTTTTTQQEDFKEDWLPEGYEKTIEGKGLIIRGWAPQVVILEHKAVGGFVTHCGWNSTLEAITAGVPMVTWPVAADQFFNEMLATEVLKIGVGVGAEKWASSVGAGVPREAIEKAVARVMVGEEAEEMRGRVMKLGKLSRRAVQEGGSSYCNLNAFIEEFCGPEV